MDITPWHERRLIEDKHRRNDHRSPYQRDRARILHSAAFRRLQAKTQVLGIGLNDFLPNSINLIRLKLAKLVPGCRAQLKQKHPEQNGLLDSMSLIESLCLAHDIGHPPFGHGGEVALNYMMRDHGGFEGNGQTFRILTRIEPYTEYYGMNLCRRTLLGILKYPAPYSLLYRKQPRKDVNHFRQLKPSQWPPVKGLFDDDLEILDWVLAPLSESDKAMFLSHQLIDGSAHRRTQYKSFDCSIMELADDIAYAVHDLEDAIVMGIVSREQWLIDVEDRLKQSKDDWIKNEFTTIGERLFSSKHHLRKDAIGTLVNGFVTAISITENTRFEEPLLRYNAALEAAFDEALEILKQFVYRYVIRKPEIQMLEYKGQQIVMELFEAFISDPERLLPINTQERWKEAQQQGLNCHRVIADYISGMTDEFAARLHQHLFSPKSGSMIELNREL